MRDSDAFVFVLLGQSNAVGHNLPMKDEDKLKFPLKNVFGLKRSLNQSYDNEKLIWSCYSCAEMNLAEEQDDTYSVANCMALRWQTAIDSGVNLPDLYIVHIAIGAEGVTEKYMWYPQRDKKLISGKLGTVDISLHSFTRHILKLVSRCMKENGKMPCYLMHWRGGEEEMCVPKCVLENQLQDIYEKMFDDYYSALGEVFPIGLHRIVAYERAHSMDESGASESLDYINEIFEKLREKHSNISVFDVRTCPYYSPEKEHRGVFMQDDVHFTHQVNDWIASVLVDEIKL